MTMNPASLSSTASHYNITLPTESYLLPYLLQHLTTPLPPIFSNAVNELGEDGYVEDYTGLGSVVHPGDRWLRKVVERVRHEELVRVHQKSVDNRNDDDTNQWIEFTDENSTKYYHNFHSNASSTQLTLDMNIMKVHPQKPPPPPQIPIPFNAYTTIYTPKSTPETLRYRSWWMISNKSLTSSSNDERNEIEVVYFTATKELCVRVVGPAMDHGSSGGLPNINNKINTNNNNNMNTLTSNPSSQTYTIPTSPNLTLHTFHIGHTLTILGREITLMQCDIATRKWYNTELKRLQYIKRILSNEVCKYDDEFDREVRKAQVDDGDIKRRNWNVGGSGRKEASLGKIAGECEGLVGRLEGFRESEVERVLKGL